MKKVASRVSEVDDSTTAIKEEPTNNLPETQQLFKTEKVNPAKKNLKKHGIEVKHNSI